MRQSADLSHLPSVAEFWALAKLADRFVEAINRSPYDALTGAWKPSDLLPPDDRARTECPAPQRQSTPKGLLGSALEVLNDRQRAAAAHVENERRYRVALQSRFLVELAADAAYCKLHDSPEFPALLDAFDHWRRGRKHQERSGSPDAEARFISAVATSLAFLRGGRAKVANKDKREQAAHLIDKLLAMRGHGIAPPLIGFVHDAGGTRLAWLADELKRWRDELCAPPRDGRLRHQRNDPHLGHRQTIMIFRRDIESAFGSAVVADSLAERFAAVIGYRNPAAQASR